MSDEIRQLPVSEIKVGTRHRRDLGDLHAFAARIEAIGLLQPIGVTPQMELIFGERRLRACREVLGWETIPARIIPIPAIALGEYAENLERKDFTPSERVAIMDTLRGYGHGGDRRSDRGRNCDVDRLSIKRAAALVGDSKDDYYRAKKVVEHGVTELVQAMDQEVISVSLAAKVAEEEPEIQREIVRAGALDATTISREIRALKQRGRIQRQREGERTALALLTPERDWIVTGDQAVVPGALLLADPPYGITEEPWEPDDLEAYTREWAARWAGCGTDFIAVFWSQRYEREGRAWLDESLEGYKFQQKLIWPAPNSMRPKSRSLFKQTWEPIFLYRRSGCERLIHDHGTTWTGELHDKDCHIAAVPQTTYSGDDLKQHPCQKPVSVMRWLIHALTLPGERVVSLFCGVAPCGVAALQLGRTYHGIEINPEYRQTAEGRLASYGVSKKSPSVGSVVPHFNGVTQGDCMDLIPMLPVRSINLALTSPPYAEQRNGFYQGMAEHLYPEFTVRWMSLLWDKLTDDGSVLIVIDSHVEEGIQSDYVQRTEQALREFGWTQHRTQIWYKPDVIPLGHKWWPRHCYEQILWFSKSGKPFCDPWADGKPTERLGLRGYRWSQWSEAPVEERDGIAKVTDVIKVPVGLNDKGIEHPAMYPVPLAEKLIMTFCPQGGTLLDNFCGSGSTLVAAKKLDRNYYGFDLEAEYCRIARDRLAALETEIPPLAG